MNAVVRVFEYAALFCGLTLALLVVLLLGLYIVLKMGAALFHHSDDHVITRISDQGRGGLTGWSCRCGARGTWPPPVEHLELTVVGG